MQSNYLIFQAVEAKEPSVEVFETSNKFADN